MIVYGVNRGGKTIQVLGDFSIHIPYGYCYCINENAASDEPVLTVIKTAERLSDYTDGVFFIPDGTDCEVILPFRAKYEVNVAADAKEVDFDLDGFLRHASENASNHTINMDFSFNGQNAGTKTLGAGDFRRRYRLVNNTPFLKAGYFTSGLFGRTTYTTAMITRHYLYMATLRSSSMDYDRLEQNLEELLSGMAALDDNTSITVMRSDRFRDDSQAQSESPFAGSVLYPSAYFQKDTKIEIDLSALSMERTDTLYFGPPEKAGDDAVDAEKCQVSEESESFPVRLGEPNEPTDFVFTRTSAEGVALLDCLSTARVVVVPAEYSGEPVAAIRENGFKKVAAMEKLILPKTVRSIGKNAFDGCKNLKSMAWYGEDTAEGDFMIRDKSRLSFLFTASSEYMIPNDIKSIGNYAFTGCSKLKKITLHKGLSRIASDAFSACKTLKTIVLPADWGKLNITALAKAKIKEVILPSGAAVKITDPYLYDFFDVSSGSYVFDYADYRQTERAGKRTRERGKEEFTLKQIAAVCTPPKGADRGYFFAFRLRCFQPWENFILLFFWKRLKIVQPSSADDVQRGLRMLPQQANLRRLYRRENRENE